MYRSVGSVPNIDAKPAMILSHCRIADLSRDRSAFRGSRCNDERAFDVTGASGRSQAVTVDLATSTQARSR